MDFYINIILPNYIINNLILIECQPKSISRERLEKLSNAQLIIIFDYLN